MSKTNFRLYRSYRISVRVKL